MERTTSIRIPEDLLDQADRVATLLSQTHLPDFGGRVTRSGTIRRAIRIGLNKLEQELEASNGNL
jgi:metal-responsive CopG/Arc/MetJ family transcriptional regulator